MATWIKAGFWEKLCKPCKGYKGWLNLDQLIESMLPTPAYRVYTALVTQNGGDDSLSIDSGLLTIGVTYMINNPTVESDFTNVGAPNNLSGTYFVATGTTPNNWGTDSNILLYNTGAPVVTVLENTIGNVWFNYEGVGTYSVNSNGLFTIGKTMFQGVTFYSSDVADLITINTYPESNSISKIYLNKVSGNNNYVDGYLYSPGVPIEIRVYN